MFVLGRKTNSLLFLSYFIMWCYLVQHLLWTCLLMQAFDLFIYLKIVFFLFFFPFSPGRLSSPVSASAGLNQVTQ